MPAGIRRDQARTAFLSIFGREEPSMQPLGSLGTKHFRLLSHSSSSEDEATLRPFRTACRRIVKGRSLDRPSRHARCARVSSLGTRRRERPRLRTYFTTTVCLILTRALTGKPERPIGALDPACLATSGKAHPAGGQFNAFTMRLRPQAHLLIENVREPAAAVRKANHQAQIERSISLRPSRHRNTNNPQQRWHGRTNAVSVVDTLG